MASIEQDFKPSGRPTSMMAQRFSMLLDSSFGLDETTESVIKKKEEVASAAAELEELQARLAAMEEKLNGKNNTDKLSPSDPPSAHSRSKSVSQKPYLPGPIALSVRPETPRPDEAGEGTTQKKATLPTKPAQPQQIPSRRFLSLRRKQPPTPPEEEDDSEDDDEDDSDGSDEEEDDSETSSSEEPVRRK